MRDSVCRAYSELVDEVASRMKQGTASACFAVDFLQSTEKSDMSWDQKLFVIGSFLEGGGDTTKTSLGQLVAAAAVYPDWVLRAREHLDQVCGTGAELRLPSWDDKHRLKYISAVLKEVFRWRPFVPLGIMHVLTEDDEYEGYKFPAGTAFSWNAYHISQNPDEYEDPERFWPERFLNDDVENTLQGHWAFGAGKSLSLDSLYEGLLSIPLIPYHRKTCLPWLACSSWKRLDGSSKIVILL
jgi:cytochrome P450